MNYRENIKKKMENMMNQKSLIDLWWYCLLMLPAQPAQNSLRSPGEINLQNRQSLRYMTQIRK